MDESETTSTRPVKNGRSANTFCCAFCHQYHQSRKRGRCKYITGPLPGVVEFVKRFDGNEQTSFARQGVAFETENALRRVVAFATENRDLFQTWAAKSSAEFPVEHHVAPLIPVEATVVVASSTTTVDDTVLKSAEPRKGPAPAALTYEYLRSCGKIEL